MLKNIDPLLSGDLLKILDDMGHADRLLLVDANYPAAASGKPVIRLGEVGVVRALQAILSVFPLDSFVERPLERMEAFDDPSIVTDVQREVLATATQLEGRSIAYGVIPRLELYERARECYAVVHTLETAPYSCFILHKGVI